MQVLVLESERFLPHLRCFLSTNFLLDYARPLEMLTNAPPTFWKMRDVLSKATIFSGVADRAEEGGAGRGREAETEKLLARQRQLEDKVCTLKKL